MLFSKNMSKNLGNNMSKNLSSQYSRKLFDQAKQSVTASLKTPSKKEIPKTAEAAGDLIGNEIADKITKFSGTSPKRSSETVTNEAENIECGKKIPKERHLSSIRLPPPKKKI